MTGDSRLKRPLSTPWPVSVRVPLVVALLMITISVAVSDRVLSRLQETQERNLQQLASAYLDGLSAAVVQSVVREDVWEVFDTLDRSRQRYRSLNVQWVAVANAEGRVVASSDPGRFPSLEIMPAGATGKFIDGQEVMLDEADTTARMSRSLVHQDQEIGRIYAEADIAELMQERADVLRELIISNAFLAMLLIGSGYYAVRRMLRPVGLLSNYFAHGRAGTIQAIPEQVVRSQGVEFRDLFMRYNALAQAVSERELLAAELAEEEKLASVGRLASGMAHEINNPLGGMFNALDSLKRHGAREDVRTTSIRLLEQGLAGIRDLVRSTLTTYRSGHRPRDLTATDLDDLRLLVKSEARLRKLRMNWQVDLDGPVHIPAVPVRDAILNLLLNACHSSHEGRSVGLKARVSEGCFIADVSDDGGGLPSHLREYLEREGAGAVPLDRRSGLGLWIVKRHCDEMRAMLKVIKSDTSGTVIRLIVPLPKELERAA